MKYCIECSRNKATRGDFCDSCFNETKICRRCQQRKSIFEFEKNQKSIAGKVSRRGECRDCRKWKRPIPEKAREEFEKTNPQPPMGKPFHYIETGYKMATGYFAHFLVLSIK